MKQKLTLLLLALLATVGAWADVLTLTPSNGTYVTSSGNYVNSITFSTTPAVTVTADANNMDKRQTGSYLLWHSGTAGSSTYTISVSDRYLIKAYSVTGEANTSSQTLTAGSNSHEFAVGTSSSFDVTGLGASSVSFVQTGANASGLKITSISVTVEEIPDYVDWTPSVEDAFLTVGGKATSISPVTETSDNSKWYILTQVRGGETPMYDAGMGSKLRRAATSVTTTTLNGTSVSESAIYLIRFVNAGEGLYNVQFADGNWITSSLTTASSKANAGTYAFYFTNDAGALAWNKDNKAGDRVDNNGAGNDVSFWGRGENTATSGNNIWTIYETTVEVPTSTIEVTYAQYVNGVATGLTITETVLPNSEINVPSNFYSGYSSLGYIFSTEGTIGEENVTIKVNINKKNGVVLALSELSNNKAYSLVTERGTFTTDNGELANTAKSGSNYTIYNFAIVKHDNAYYLWSVQDGKFVAGNDKALTETPTSITINILEESPLFKIQCGSNYLNCNVNGGGFFSSWSTTDGGNRVAIIEAADFDPTPVIEALTNFAPSVVANIKPFFDAAGSDLFQLKASVAEANNATYTAALTSCNAATYDALLAVVSNADNFNLPEAGKFYLVKNNYNGKYMRVTASGKRGTVFADLTAEEAAKDASAYICFTADDNDSKLYMRSQGKYFNWVYNMSGYEAYLADGKDKYVHFAAPAPGIGAFSIALGNGEGENAGALNPGFYALWDESTNVVGGSNNGAINEKAQWTFEEASTLSIDLNGPVGGSYYATFCVPFDVNFGTSAAAFTLSKDGTTLETTEVTGNTVPAGTPVLLVGEGNSATATIGSSYTNAPISGTALTGNFFAIPFDGSTNYTLGSDGTKVGFYHWNGTTLNANRAYIAGSGSGVKGFVLNFDDDATAIKDLTDLKDSDGLIYNLAGQRISKMQKGINIMNGKKIVVK